MAQQAEIQTSALRRLHASHARAIAEQADRHAVTLESLLAILRSSRLDDRAARNAAIDTAAAALVDLRMLTDRQRSAILEPVSGAFRRLRNDLRPLERFGELEVQFVEPPSTGRALPGEVAHEARAMVRSAALAIVDQGVAKRIRIHWDCDGLNLLIGIRDDGPGDLTAHDESLRPVVERISALHGELKVSSTPGWGSALDIRLPLDPPSSPDPLVETVLLSAREQEVLRLLASGARNLDIARQLGISASTVKFHVSNLLKKSGTRSRAELAAVALSHQPI